MMRIPLLFRALSLAGAVIVCMAAGAAELVVGQVAPLTGLEGSQARGYSAGLQLALTKANKGGGASGHTFTLVRKDDGGRPADTLAATRQLLTDIKPLVLAGYFGERGVSELVASGLLEKESLALVGYRVSEIRAETPLVYSVRANLRDEISKIADHLSTVGITRFGLFYPDGPGAQTLLTATEEVMKTRGSKLVAKAAYAQGTNKVPNSVVDTFITAAPQAIMLVASGSAAAAFIEKYRMDGGAAQLFAQSGADIEQISQRLGGDHLKGLSITQVTPSPYRISGRLSKEFSEALAATPNLEVPASYAMMEGYITGGVIVEAVRRMGPRATREGFVKALDSIDNLDLGGYRVGFKPGMRSGSKFVELTIITADGRVRQ